MTAQNELDRALGAWFDAEAAPAPPPEPLVRILETTSGQRPRPSFVAGIGSHWVGGSTSGVRAGIASLRPVFVVALVALLALALVGGAVLVGSRLVAPLLPKQHTYSDEFIQAPDLPRAMGWPLVAPLLDGRVLVTGVPNNGEDPTPIALLYDPLTGVSTPVGPLVAGFVGSVAVRLLDGRVLIMGDRAAQIFDPTTMRFAPVGAMVDPRVDYAVALLHDGRVLLAGGSGVGGFLSSAELFDPDSLTFSPTGPMGTPGYGGPMATLPDGRVFAASIPAEVYDPTTGSFSAAGSMSTPFRVSSVISLPDGRVIVFGSAGYAIKHPHAGVWDPTSLTFLTAVDPPGQVHSATLLDDGRILLIGGQFPGRDPIWSGIYDPATGVTTLNQAPEAWWPTATRLSDGRVLLVGGLRDGEFHVGPNGGMEDAPAVPTVQIFR